MYITSFFLMGNLDFSYEINGFINTVNLTRCKRRFFKLLDISVININLRRNSIIYSNVKVNKNLF